MKPQFILSLLALSISACSEKPTSPPPAAEETSLEEPEPKSEASPCCANEPEVDVSEVSQDSIYQIDSTWKNQDDTEVKLSSLAGKIQVITMGYSVCEYACPRLMADMKSVEKGLTAEQLEKVSFNFFSIDQTDTPESLTAFGERHNVDKQRWSFYTADLSTVQELAVVLGTNFRKTSDKDFAHSNLITVLNEKGEIVHRQEGLSGPSQPVIDAITQAALAEE